MDRYDLVDGVVVPPQRRFGAKAKAGVVGAAVALVGLVAIIGFVSVNGGAGTASLRAAPAAASVQSIGSVIDGLATELQDMFKDGRHMYSKTFQTEDPIALIKQYLEDEGGEGGADGYTFLTDQLDIAVDTMEAGTLRGPDIAEEEVISGCDNLAHFIPDTLVQEFRKRIPGLISELATAGVVFGYDGLGQNACAAPSPTLLILNLPTGEAWSVDLDPCTES